MIFEGQIVGQGKLTVKKVRVINEPGFYGDGNTLFMRVAPGGSKQWVQRLTIYGKRRDIGLGGCNLVTLAEARQAAWENRRVARSGGDPRIANRKPPPFREAAQKTYESLRPRWRNEKVAANWMQQLKRYAFDKIGDIPVNGITQKDVLAVLTPIWTSKPETARRVRRNIRSTLQWCQAHEYVQFNAAGEGIDGALPRMPAVKSHLRALPHREMPVLMKEIESSRSRTVVRLALRFLILTATRSGEVRGARWSEVDFEHRTWRIPGDRMKAGGEHRVPLAKASLDVLEQARGLHNGSGLVFPSPLRRDRPLSDMTLTKLLRDAGLADRTTVHGFRSTFRDWCADTGQPREIAEAALAHSVGGVEGAYFRSDLFERRRHLMESWAEFIAK